MVGSRSCCIIGALVAVVRSNRYINNCHNKLWSLLEECNYKCLLLDSTSNDYHCEVKFNNGFI